MRVKTFVGLVFILLATVFVACDDDLNTVGGTIRPGHDNTGLEVDTIQLTAKTTSLNNSIYARNLSGLLGEYNDPIFGDITSDYLAEFRANKNLKFEDKAFKVDSVEFILNTTGFIGDSTQLIGLTSYELNKPLEDNYLTNIDPADFCDLSKPIGQASFIYKDARTINEETQSTQYEAYWRILKIKADTTLGHNFIKKWKNDPEVLKDATKLREFFPGIYTTTTYGSNSLITVATTSMNIHYKYVGRNKADDKDSIRVSVLKLFVAPEVIQINRVENKFPQELEAELALDKSDKTYLKTPAGVYTEITIPLGKIMESSRDEKGDKMISSASFSIKGATEDEADSKLKRPSTLLFVNKDSIENFFQNKRIDNNKYIFLMTRNKTNNTYYFSESGNNISQMIDHYKEVYKDKDTKNLELKYLVIPVVRETTQVSSSVLSTVRLYHVMEPTSAILRTDEKNLNMSFIYTKYENRDNKKK